MMDTQKGDVWEMESVTVTRTARVGVSPVLTVRAVYPQMVGDVEDVPPAVERFNQTYRRAAEAFMAWALEEPSRQAMAAFEAMGQGAAYRFGRWELCLAVTPVWEEADERLAVTTTVTWAVRRETTPRKTVTRKDVWRMPWVCLEGGREKTIKKIDKIRKNAGYLLKKNKKCDTM